MKDLRLRSFNVLGFLGLACSIVFFAGICQAAFIDLTASSNSQLNGSFNFNGFGNTYTDTGIDNEGDTVTVRLSAHSLDGGSFVDSQLRAFSTFGFGACNPDEGFNCVGSGPHAFDNVANGPDFILFQFDKPIVVAVAEIRAFADTDAMYFFGTGNPDFSFLANNLGTATQRPDERNGNFTTRDVVLDVGGVANPVDWILLGASVGNPDGRDDRFKVKGLFFETPLPPVAVLFGTGLVGLIGLARRSKIL